MLLNIYILIFPKIDIIIYMMKNMDLNIKVAFNKNYIKKYSIFRHNGIIFGGYVCSYIIAKQ
jgi:hypothetical protein